MVTIREFTITYEDFCRKIQWFNEDEFQQFCDRFQKVMSRKYRATKAIGPHGDWNNDGIINFWKRMAAYAIHYDTIDKDNSIATKMKKDFNKMMKSHPSTTVMIFMTRTTEGMGPKVQKMKEKLESPNYLFNLYEEYKTECSDEDKMLFPYDLFRFKKVEYLDCKDIFAVMMDIGKVTTWEYVLENKITLPLIAELPKKQLDDPAYMAEWLMAAVIRFDNIEAPVPMKIKEIDNLIDNLSDKINRDKRKYNVLNLDEIPYEPWRIVAIPTPNSEDSHAFSPEFEIPVPLGDDGFIKMELTPDMLLIIICMIRRVIILGSMEEHELFTDRFLSIYAIVNTRKKWAENSEVDRETVKVSERKNSREWRNILREWTVKQSNELFD